jgi:hypothetical protein
MVHPDYQYTPKLIPAMAGMVASGLYSCVLASRILGGQARAGGMPLWRYVSNRALTFAGNLLLGTKVSEFHTGYRAYSRELLERLPLDANSDDFVFDNEVLAETAWLGHAIGEVSCPTRYASGRVFHQLPSQRDVRLWMSGHGGSVQTCEVGADSRRTIPALIRLALTHDRLALVAIVPR